jgi:hypothetical protein
VSTPGARWRDHSIKGAVTGVVLAGMVAGCSTQHAVAPGSVAACARFGAVAIRDHVTVTARPPACRELTQTEVNVAVGEALRAAASGVRGKVRQRQVIARDSRYLAGLVLAVPAPGSSAVTAPSSASPSRTALGLAALIAWLVTVGLGVSMMARWITRTRRRGVQSARWSGAALNLAHLGLALAGLPVWIGFLATGLAGLAWVACGLLVPVASLGVTLVFLGRRPPVLVVAAHIAGALATILLTVLAAVGPG